MQEITRIHIAKTSYDIEIDAKKELEEYIKQLSLFVDDQEVMADVEVRMTELLTERGVAKNGVVALEDVRAVREQLGEPHEFAGDDDDVLADAANEALADSPRRLYRDVDTAALGGVLGGIAKFFGINPLWTRLGFLLVLLVSFGTASIVYIVLWFVVPPARTTAEKLQLEGRPITLANMKELREQAGEVLDLRRTPRILKSALIYTLGVLSAIGAVCALVATIWGAGLIFGTSINSPMMGVLPDSPMMWLAYGLFVVSGLLLTTFGVVVSYTCFSRRMSKRIGIAMVVIVVAGVAAFGSGVGSMLYGNWQESARVDALRQTSKVALPSDFANVKRLSASAHAAANGQGGYADFTIEYIVDAGTPRYVLEALPDVKPNIVINGDQARIVLKASSMQNRGYGHTAPRLVIYGPALDEVKSEQGQLQYTALYQTKQDSLAVQSTGTTAMTIFGTYGTVQIAGQGSVDASASSIHDLSISTTVDSVVTAGVVRTLTVMQPDVCPAQPESGMQRGNVSVQGVTSGEMTYNGKIMAAQSHSMPCGAIELGNSDDDRYED